MIRNSGFSGNRMIAIAKQKILKNIFTLIILQPQISMHTPLVQNLPAFRTNLPEITVCYRRG